MIVMCTFEVFTPEFLANAITNSVRLLKTVHGYFPEAQLAALITSSPAYRRAVLVAAYN